MADESAHHMPRASRRSPPRHLRWLSLGEVADQLERRHGHPEAADVVRRLRSALTLDKLSPERVLAAARLTAEHPITFADCFAAATAAARGSTLLTGDHKLLDRKLGCRVRDLRPTTR